jgi:osmotically-inducible protein OsmY
MRLLLVFLVGVGLGAVGYHMYLNPPRAATATAGSAGRISDAARDAAQTAAAKTHDFASSASDTLNQKIRDWHLTPEDIRADLAKSGEVVRQNATRAGEKFSDARIISVIKAKYVLDRELSANDIEVRSDNGRVTLTGTVSSPEMVGKAVAHALDTDGVHHVVARLQVH